ncbi:BamA/TamA family outer membrane protein [Xanthomarina sp. GH4-25]|uniref:BamA/TamA family outer membrane protein n=1 Tax=Xanthomarina sp. GH4-25 TaxID=3349335 RepID=UPI003877BE68
MLFVSAQTKPNSSKDKNQKFSLKVLKDSLDGQLDMSDALIDYNGFIPVPQIVTEPALGGLGLMLAPVFIKPNKVQEEGKYIPPNITAGFIGYTANKTWGFGGMRMASLPKYHLKYRVGAVYGDVNMDFYRNLPLVGEQEFNFNFRIIGAFASVLREISDTGLFLGLEYFYGLNKITPEFEHFELPDFVKEKDLKSNISSLGVNMEYDKRDNVFTPDSGWYITSEYRVNADWTGSDYNFQNFNLAIIKYFQVSPKWVSGLRLDTQFQFGDAPFYLEPSVSLRGVPMARYQGNQVYVLETEQRYDFAFRWSAIGFAGLAKAPTEKVSFNDSLLVYNYGGGFRYLIARKFKIRTGIDVAWSNGDFGWYVVFGCAWNNRN